MKLYENITYESILERMIARVKWAGEDGSEDRTNLDTREGSLIRTALSPAAVELKQMYIDLDEILKETFADTATREFLIRRCAERGIKVVPATSAIWKGEFNIDVPDGSRFSHKQNQMKYRVTEKISKGLFKLECETPGTAGNYEGGILISLDYISGLESAKLTEILLHGEDEEPTEHLRRRYFDSLNSLAFGGNIADYKNKVNSIQNVGGCKIYPVWNGGGTVKVVFMDFKNKKPSDALVDNVQTKLDPIRNKGEGWGIAPIGHVVTVEGVEETVININTHITFQTGYDWDRVKTDVESVIEEYFDELSVQWDKVDWEKDQSETLYVSVYYVASRMLAVNGIKDVQDIYLNGKTANIALLPNNIPKRGTLTHA